MNQLRSLSQAFRRAALPLASYYAVTLALPLAHGAPSSDRFLEHALVVLLVPVLLVLGAWAVRATVHRLAGRAESVPPLG